MNFREIVPFLVLVMGVAVQVAAAFAPPDARKTLEKLGDMLLGGGLFGMTPGVRTILGGERATDPSLPAPPAAPRKETP